MSQLSLLIFLALFKSDIIVKVNITYSTKVIQLKQLYCKVIVKGWSWEEGGSFLVGQVNIYHVTIGDIFNIFFDQA